MNKADKNQLNNANKTPITGQEHSLTHCDVDIYILEKYKDSSEGKPVVVLAHGSATAGRESFDLSVQGKPSYSLMNYLAETGFDVFTPDIRGFGRSTKPDGHVNTQQACEDLNAAVDYILRIRKIKQVHILGWSWGTQYAGLFTMTHPDKVSRYISYAQMHVNSPDIILRRTKTEMFRNNPYITIPQQGWKARFYSMTPESVNDPEVIDAYAHAAARIEVQTPTGPQLDMVNCLPLVHAKLIPVPTMVIHGEYDDVADPEGLFPFFTALPNPDKKYVIVPQAGHMMHLQKSHKRFQYEVRHFLATDTL